jgi:hypothetical protein
LKFTRNEIRSSIAKKNTGYKYFLNGYIANVFLKFKKLKKTNIKAIILEIEIPPRLKRCQFSKTSENEKR